MKKVLSIVFLITFFSGFLYFYSPLLQGRVPVPLDTLVGLNHPYLDFLAKGDPTFRGIPMKNSLIGDPVIQIIPWKVLALHELAQSKLPLWNPYQMAGYPLIANVQSSVFYPLNVFLFIQPFLSGWTVLIVSQQLLAAGFMYLYLRNLSLEKTASMFGSFVFSFCGFFVAWFEWGTILHTALWLPLLLFSIDKLTSEKKKKWLLVMTITIICSYLGGHLQTFLYSSLLSLVYLLFRAYEKKSLGTVVWGVSSFILGMIILSPLISSQLQLISLSARNIDQDWRQIVGWFIPWQHVIQFIAPDFFGNPATGNYWGVWNYGEFIGYIGIIPLLCASIALFYRKDKITLFYLLIVLVALLLALPTIFGKLPFKLHIPFLSSTQPTRLIYIVDFGLAILAALGFDYAWKHKQKIIIPGIGLLGILALVAVGGYIGFYYNLISLENWSVTQRNLVLPFGFTIVGLFLLMATWFDHRYEWVRPLRFWLLFLFTIFDLLFFANKFTPFARTDYYYPETKLITFLKNNVGIHRIMNTDRSILHPNITTYYRIQSVDGYDPLYLQTYGEFIAAMERMQPNIQPPFGFNRILTPNSFFEKFGSLIGIKYLLSQQDLPEPYLKKVYTEGTIHVYENKNVFPRAFLVSSIRKTTTKQQTIDAMFEPNLSLRQVAVVQTDKNIDIQPGSGDRAMVTSYEENKVTVKTETNSTAFLVLTDAYYPSWRAYVDGKETSIYVTDFAFRGVVVPGGSHTVEFTNKLF